MNNNKSKTTKMFIYQSKTGKIEFRGDFKKDTIWGTQQQIADVFEINRTVITKHINNIIKSREIPEKSNVQKMHFPHSDKPVKLYSLDIILAVGYRTNSAKAVLFRKWATKTLKQHLLEGYTINKKQLAKNYQKFQKTLQNIKVLLPKDKSIDAGNAVELISVFASTWFSLEAYDSEKFPEKGWTQKKALFTAEELTKDLQNLKADLILKKQATELFGKERQKNAIAGVVGNIFQSFGGKDLYSSLEEKAAHLLYFMVKNHPFTDGNKRSGAFSFIWFLRKAAKLPASLTPEALTALTLLVAESDPKDKDKMIGLTLLLLKGK